MSENRDPFIGKIIDDKYEIEEKIGEGGFATVYRARHIHLRNRAAIKILLDKYFSNSQALNRFHREAKIIATLKHKNIVEIFNFSIPTENSPAYIAMELLRGSALDKILQTSGKFPLDKATDLMLQICEGVEAAHLRRIIHRDLKPANIFITEAGENDSGEIAKVLDFGLAKPLFNSESWQPLTRLGEIVGGSEFYMSPEQYEGGIELDEKTDIYSLGLVFYEILSGRRPYSPQSPEQLRDSILTENPPSLHQDGVPLELVKIIEKAYSKDRESRYRNATDLKEDLKNWQNVLGDLDNSVGNILPPEFNAPIAGAAAEPVEFIEPLAAEVNEPVIAAVNEPILAVEPIEAPPDEPVAEIQFKPMFYSGRILGQYKLVKELGSGAFGIVWLAEKKSRVVPKKLAIKFPIYQADFDAVKQEATLWEKASAHPNILPFIEADIIDGQIIIVSEYSPDGSLMKLLDSIGGKLPIEKAIEMTTGILRGLEFLHSQTPPIIHRDLKPDNVLLQGDTPRLADFGLSRVLKSTNPASKVGGTLEYMAPEAFERGCTKQTDVWSVGVILYELLKGELPFSGEYPKIMLMIIQKDPKPLPVDIPSRLKEIVLKALTKNPALRYKTADAMRKDLNDFWLDYSRPGVSPPAADKEPPGPIKPPPGKKPLLVPAKTGWQLYQEKLPAFWNKLRGWQLITGLAALLILVFGGYLIWTFINQEGGVKLPSSSTKLVSSSVETSGILAANSNAESVGSLDWIEPSPVIRCHFINSANCKAIFSQNGIKPYSHFNKCDRQSDVEYTEEKQNLYEISKLTVAQADNLETPKEYQVMGAARYRATLLLAAEKHTIFESVDGKKSIAMDGMGFEENIFSIWYEENTATKEGKLFCDLCKKERLKFVECDAAKYVMDSISNENPKK